MPGLSQVIFTSSLILGDSVSYGRRYERDYYRRTLLGAALGGLGSGSSIDSSPVTGTNVPSWTNVGLGANRNASYVHVSLSSSDHESQVLNLFNSGTEAMESSVVAVTRSLYYSKVNQLQTIIVKLTSSQATGLVDDANFGTLISPSSSINYPLKFNFSVPVTGKLTDIKVWVEIVMLSSSNDVGSTGSAGHLVWAGMTGNYQPLESIGISLRSPNVSWPGHWAHPIMNDPGYLSHGIGLNFQASTFALTASEFYRDSYLLWEGPALFDRDYSTFPIFTTSSNIQAPRQFFPVWEQDWGMRTVFYDGSGYSNPRVLQLGVPPDLNISGAPNVTGTWPNLVPGTYQHGNNVPWTSDSGSWGNASSNLSVYNVAGSPPVGWLTGPGGTTASFNEWPTTGTNYGAPNLQPVYPLLDSIYQKFVDTNFSKWAGGALAGQVPFPYPDYSTWRGFRPGLKNTEISGTWTLMFSRPPSGSAATGNSMVPWAFVRQCRLEITYYTGRQPSGLSRIFRPSQNPRKGGERFWGFISGSDRYHRSDTANSGQGCFLHATYTTEQATPGTIFGLFIGTGSAPSDVALEWRLSGGVLAAASGTGPGWLTNNQFGMPAIPLVSWSLGFPIVPVPVSASVNPLGAIFPARSLDGAQRLAAVADAANPAQSLRQIAQGLSTGSH